MNNIPKHFIWIILSMSHMLLGTDKLEAKFFEAKNYFEVGDYETSSQLLKKMLKDSMQPLQEASVKFNLATSLLKEGQYEKAIHDYEAILAEGQKDPLLLYRLHCNTAIAHYLVALEGKQALEEPTKEGLDRILTSIKQALAQNEKSLGAYKDLMIATNGDSDSIPETYYPLKQGLKQIRDQLVKEREAYLLKQMDLNTVLMDLNQRLSQLSDQCEKIGSKVENIDHQQHFMKQRFIRDKNLKTIWARGQELYQENIDKLTRESNEDPEQSVDVQAAKQKKQFFDYAQNDFLAALDYMRTGKVWQTRQFTGKAYEKILLLTEILKEKDPLLFLLDRRIKQDGALVAAESLELQNIRQEEAKDRSALACLLAQEIKRELESFQNEELKLDNAQPENPALKQENIRQAIGIQLMQQLVTSLQEQSKHFVNEREKLCNDFYLYHMASHDEVELLMELMTSFLQKEKVLDHHLVRGQLNALQEKLGQVHHYELQNVFKPYIHRARHHVRQAYDLGTYIDSESRGKIYSHLEQALWEYAPLIQVKKQLKQNSQEAEALLTKDYFDQDASLAIHEKIEKLLDKTTSLKEHPKFSEHSETIIPNLHVSHDQQVKGLNLFLDKKPANAQICLGESGQSIYRLLRNLDRDKFLDAQKMLGEGIQEVQHGVHLHHPFAQTFEKPEAFFREFEQADISHALREVEGFEEALAEQMQEQENDAKNGLNLKEIVQNFRKGKAELQQALSFLEKPNFSMNDILNKQQLCLKYWQQALNQLQNPSNSNNSNNSSGSDDSKQSPPSSEEEHQANPSLSKESYEPPSNDIQKVLRELQEMDSEDQQPSSDSQTVKKGLKPW